MSEKSGNSIVVIHDKHKPMNGERPAVGLEKLCWHQQVVSWFTWCERYLLLSGPLFVYCAAIEHIEIRPSFK